jgi:hypothetical protein
MKREDSGIGEAGLPLAKGVAFAALFIGEKVAEALFADPLAKGPVAAPTVYQRLF